jgi:hypothetical protein
MYQLLRRIHLFTGLILLVFVLMYFLSGYIIIHANWFGGREPRTSTQSQTLAVSAPASDTDLVAVLQRDLGLRGQPSAPEHRNDGSIRVNFVRPGTTFQASIAPGGKEVAITRKDFGFAGIANGMHRLRGYHGGWMYSAWSALYDLASLALIVFGVTGVILWYQSTSRHLSGWLCLGASFGFTTAMILYLMFSR